LDIFARRRDALGPTESNFLQQQWFHPEQKVRWGDEFIPFIAPIQTYDTLIEQAALLDRDQQLK
jgi:hypothetical protein